MDPRGRVALVTGSARRLGRAIAAALAERGALLAVHHHASQAETSAAVREFERMGSRARAFQADLLQPRQIEGLFRAVESEFGRLDILVNSAAIFERQTLLEITADDWDRVLALNLRAPFLCAQAAARQMARTGAGKIINIADVAAFQAWTGYAHYTAAKAGLIALTRVLAKALAPGIQVNAVAPGPVLPPDGLSAADRQQLANLTALKRLGSPEDVARAVVFLVESDYVTGATLTVDGGKLLL